MSRQTHFLVQSFDPAKGNQLRAGASVVCRTEEGARRTAERLALIKTGVVAFSTTSDAETGDYDDLSLPEIKSGYIGDGDRQGLDSKECFQRALPRAISAHPCSMTDECACRCNSPYTIAARGADGVRQIPRCDPCIPCGSNRSAVLHKRFAKVSEETSGDLEYRWT